MITTTEASVFVSDFARAAAFYTERLGFRLDFAHGDPPYFGLVQRESARLTLRLVCEPVFVGDVRQREQLLSASFTVDTSAALAALFATWSGAGVTMVQPLQTQPWGARNFILQDLDGNLLLFASPA